MSLLCAPSLIVLGDSEQFSKAVFCLMDFFLSLSCKGDERTVQASAQGRGIQSDFLLVRKGRSSTDDATKKQSAKALKILSGFSKKN